MKAIIRFLFFSILTSFFIGFNIKKNDEVLGEKIIGSTVLFSVIIFLPIFLYHRWKGKNIMDYTLTKENYNRIKNQAQNKK
tara:strand:+ start:7668 stop:7910 length:243 start_codon:yes stop_codon:yes gene_type:complete